MNSSSIIPNDEPPKSPNTRNNRMIEITACFMLQTVTSEGSARLHSKKPTSNGVALSESSGLS
jgi:hypothetical protein